MTVEEARAEIEARAAKIDIISAPEAAGCWKVEAGSLLRLFETAEPKEAVMVIFERGFTMGLEYGLLAEKLEPFPDNETLCRNWSCWDVLMDDFIRRAEEAHYDLDKHVPDDH